MKIRITGKRLPKYQGITGTNQVGLDDSLLWGANPAVVTKEETDPLSGDCGPGMIYSDIQQKCMTFEEAEAEKNMMTGFGDFMKKKKQGLPTNPFKTTGNEGTASNPMVRSSTKNNQTQTQPKSAYAKGYDFVMDPFRKTQKALQSPFMQDIYGAGAVADGLLNLATPVANYFDNQSKIKDARQKEQISRFNTLQASPKFRGNFSVNEGLFRFDDRGVNEGMFGNYFAKYGGESSNNSTMKIRIIGTPKMAYGGQSNYGLDLGRRKVYTDMPDTSSESVGSSMSQISNPKEPYVLEAEGGETIWRPDGTHFNINGERHFNNGEKLTAEQAPEGSFIFSDTKKMRIKDPQILARFGVSYKKGGVTPAQIAKKFPLNPYIARLNDPTRQSDGIGINSDTLGHNKNMQKLAELAMIQEAMKGMPPPEMSQAILGAAEGATQMAYGGYVMPKFQGTTGSSTVAPKHGSRHVLDDGNTEVYDAYLGAWVPDADYLSRYNYNGTPKQGAAPAKASPTNNTSNVKGGLGQWSDDYDTLQKLLQDPKNSGLRKAMFQNYIEDYKNSPLAKDPQGEDKFVKNFLEAQRQFMGIRAAYGDKPNELAATNWDKGGRNKRYIEEAKKLGYNPLGETDIKRFQGGYRALAKAARKPEFFENFSKYFKLSPVGVKDEEYLGMPISKDDSWVGNTTLGQLAQLRDEKPPEQKGGFLCNDKGVVEPVASGGYATAEEALKKCHEKTQTKPKYICKDGEVIQSPSGVGYDSPEQAGLNCSSNKQDEVPFDFLAPDKMNMAWKMNQMVPNIYMPEMYQLPRRQYPMALDDWFARAQNRQATYNTAMDTAAKTNQSQAVGSLLAGLVGAQDASDIAQVNSQNIDRVDRRQLADMEADFKNDVFNLGQRQEYSKGLATAQQQYDNALNKGVADYVQSYADAWQNRGDLYDINMRDPYFFRDPNSYKTEFKGSTGNIFADGVPGVGTNGAGGYEGIAASANSMYKQIYDGLTNYTDDKERRAMAQSLVKSAMNNSRQTSTQSYDGYGMPKSSSRRSTRFNFGQ